MFNALDNLTHASPRSDAERRALARAMFAHPARSSSSSSNSGPANEEMLAMTETDGEERAWQAYEQRRGVLFFTGHFGYWEMQAIAQPLQVRPVSVLARPLDNPLLHETLERIRTRTGNSVIYRQGAIRKVLRELADRGIAPLIDQLSHADAAVWTFRAPCRHDLGAARLPAAGAPVVPCSRSASGGRYRSSTSTRSIRAGCGCDCEFTRRCTDVSRCAIRHRAVVVHNWRDAILPWQATVSLDEAEADG
jgi:KDO2-lipid IV(A) lauroyltransferase